MKSLAKFNNHPSSLPLLADDVLEFHAARLLLLLRLCGKKNAIEGLTKMAKLDFFVRYPKFFVVACKSLGIGTFEPSNYVESHMIRFHYGPWDQRYYHVLAYLESKSLITLKTKGRTVVLTLTDNGQRIANQLSEASSFTELCSQIGRVKEVLGDKSGTELKNLVYRLFDEEVAQLPLEKVIN